MLQKFPIRFVQVLEVGVNPTTERSKFSDNEKLLDDVFLTGIAVNTNALVKSPNAKNLLSTALLKKAYLTLVSRESGTEDIKLLPLETIMADEKVFIELDQFPVDINKSFISMFDRAGLGAAGTESFVLTLFYNKKKK